jgi:WD40 repeat protein
VFTPDGSRVLSGSADNTLKLWDVGSGKEVRAFTGHTQSVSACVFSPDGSRVLSGSADKTLKLWDVGSGKEVRAFTGHTNGVYACAFSPGGLRVYSGSDDRTVRLWDAGSGKEIHRWAMGAGVRGLALDPNNPNRAVVALSSGVLALLDLTNFEPPFEGG